MVNAKFARVSDNMARDKQHARWMQKVYGTVMAAGYLANRGYSVEFSVLVLTGRF